MKINLFIFLLLAAISFNRNTFAQQNYYDPNNPQGPGYNPNNSPQINPGVDSTEEKGDTAQVVKEKFDFWHSPHIATLASAILPGLGQIYNKKYWKAPIVWGIMGTLGYFLIVNGQQYGDFRAAYFTLRNYRNAGPPAVFYSSDSVENIRERQNDWDNIAKRHDPIFHTGNNLSNLKYSFATSTQQDSAYVDSQLSYARDNARRTRDYMAVFSLLCYVLNMADAAVDAHFAKFDVSDNLTMKIEPSFFSYSGQPQLGLSLRLNVVDNRNRKLPSTRSN